MTEAGKILGDKLAELFQHLIDHRVIISMHLTDTDFERLTCVIGIQNDAQGQLLRVDLPNDFRSYARREDTLNIKFNFSGPDQLEYIFSTYGGRINGRELHIPWPEFVERIQRRRNFRMETPLGTKMLLKSDTIQAIFSLINISLGGAYGTLTKHNMKNTAGPLLAIDEWVYNLGIYVPAAKDQEESIIVVKKSQVRRIDHNKQRRLYKYAFEFIDMTPADRQKLTQAIYSFQRQFLQRR